MSSNKIENRLIDEKSPYLLQHAYNPVDWYPWSEEAFKKAREEDKPIFLSIGYSTCHWCHVMEHESFEDDDVAEILNENYISIKVDREERPDVDSIYMNVCQAITGQGGWPLTIIMTWDKKPFFAGTYFPKTMKYGRPGLIEILSHVIGEYKNNRDKINQSSDKIIAALNRAKAPDHESIDDRIFDNAFRYFSKNFDPIYGGFSNAPKFPTPHNLMFLLRYNVYKEEAKALKMVKKTLESMYRGGIYDHIGYGFARYSTDKQWLVPHFEKMLYDNALLTITYLECALATKDYVYADIAKDVLEYIQRDMTSEYGGFYTAEDADSEGEEGKFYVFEPKEIEAVLGVDGSIEFCNRYDISEKGNFEGKSIPNIIYNPDELDDLMIHDSEYEGFREKLYEYRNKRIHPHKDDKILTSWNGLMIAAFAIAARVLSDDSYLDICENAVDFIIDKLTDKEDRLLARYRDGEAKYLAYLDDYAFLIWGLLELFESSANPRFIKLAKVYTDEMIRLFFDKEKGGFYIYGHDAEEMIIRPKELYDGAMPSGNSVATYNLVRLNGLMDDDLYQDVIDLQLKQFAGTLNYSPPSYSFMTMASLFNNVKKSKLVLVGRGEEFENLRAVINRRFLPFTIKMFINVDSRDDTFSEYVMIDDKVTAYICKHFTCLEPITDKQMILEAIEDL